jgi:uncharacterized membrane protein YoaK (UPF0700 family)
MFYSNRDSAVPHNRYYSLSMMVALLVAALLFATFVSLAFAAVPISSPLKMLYWMVTCSTGTTAC